MVKRIKLSDTDTGSSEVPTNGDVSSPDALALLEKMDWKLWEIYKTAKRVEKYLEIEDIDVAKK